MQQRFLLGSEASRRVFFIAAVACFVVGLGIATQVGVMALPAVLPAVLILAWMGSRIRTPNEACCMCNKTRADVVILVRAERTSICDACIGLSAEIVTTEQLGKGGPWVLSTLRCLPIGCPVDVTDALFAQVDEDAEAKGGPAYLEEAQRLGNPRAIQRFSGTSPYRGATQGA